jgi:RNA polymerase sigma-70 factor (ECF subfamily)
VYQGGLVVASDRPESIDAAFARLSDREMDRCYSLAGYLLGDATEAQDATQEAMAHAWRARETLKDVDAFEGWLDRILVNACMDRMRRRKVIRFVEIEAGEEVTGRDPFHDLLAQDELGRALEVLPPEQRVVVVLRFWRDLPVDEIARRLDCPPGTVKSRLHNAITALRGRMERDAREVKR